MRWKDLSNEAKSVIEWVQNPFTDKRELISVKIGGHFVKEYLPKYSYNDSDRIDILITNELYEEITKYVTQDDNFDYAISKNGITFKLKDNVQIYISEQEKKILEYLDQRYNNCKLERKILKAQTLEEIDDITSKMNTQQLRSVIKLLVNRMTPTNIRNNRIQNS